jgi:hypothetical protein
VAASALLAFLYVTQPWSWSDTLCSVCLQSCHFSSCLHKIVYIQNSFPRFLHDSFLGCWVSLLWPFVYANTHKNTPRNLFYILCSMEIYCIFQTCCKVCFVFHKMWLIS